MVASWEFIICYQITVIFIFILYFACQAVIFSRIEEPEPSTKEFV